MEEGRIAGCPLCGFRREAAVRQHAGGGAGGLGRGPAGGAHEALSQRAEGTGPGGCQRGEGPQSRGAPLLPQCRGACASAVPIGSQGPYEGWHQGCAWLLLGVVSPHPWEYESTDGPLMGIEPSPGFRASASVTRHLGSADRPPRPLLGGGWGTPAPCPPPTTSVPPWPILG